MVAGGLLVVPLQHKPLFKDWIQFWDEAQEFFMTMETRDEAIRALHNLKQGYLPVEDYIVQFKSLVLLTEFNDYALVTQFKAGLHPKHGYNIIRVGAQETAVAIKDLKTYIWKDWEIEVEEQTIREINSLSEQDALWYIRNLRDKLRQVWAMGKNQMDVSGVIVTIMVRTPYIMQSWLVGQALLFLLQPT